MWENKGEGKGVRHKGGWKRGNGLRVKGEGRVEDGKRVKKGVGNN